MLNESLKTSTDILLVDDHPVLRLGFRLLLKKLDASFVFHEASSRDQAIALAGRLLPALILLDLTLNQEVDLSMIGELRAAAPSTAVLVVSMHDERFYAGRALQAGARGYVMKNDAAQCIAEAVRTVLDGGVWLSEQMRKGSPHGSPAAPGAGNPDALATLSDLEMAVFRLIGTGLRKADIAAHLNLPLAVVEGCKLRLRTKLGIDNGPALYRMAAAHVQEQSANQQPG